MMANEVRDAKLRLAAMQRLITGVTTAFDYMPRVLKHAELPAFVTRTESSEYDLVSMSEQVFIDQRMFRMILVVQEIGNGTEGEAEENAYPWIETVQEYFMARPGLELDSGSAPRGIVYDAQLLGDSGVIVQTYPLSGGENAQRYTMIEFRILVNIVKEIDYTSG